MKSQLIIFVKNPRLGKVKSRLARAIGEQKALDIYLKLLEITHRCVLKVPVDKRVYYADYIDKNDVWENDIFQKNVQEGGDLGERMYNAISDSFSASYEKVCLIGTDIPALNADIINEAFSRLNETDVVLGPSKDGGYYLIGMKTPHSNLFKNVSWSTSQVLFQTMNNVEKQHLKVALLQELNDIDTIEDIGEDDVGLLLN